MNKVSDPAGQPQVLTIVHPNTKQPILVGLLDEEEAMNWPSAIRLQEAALNGWRLPTIDELEAMYEQLHKNGHGSFRNDNYWSSSASSPQHSWYVSFSNGSTSDALNKLGALVRLVKAKEV